jgi:hypothetical protein
MPPMFSALKAGSSSKGKASSIQYFPMIGATLVSANSRTCLRMSCSSALSIDLTS